MIVSPTWELHEQVERNGRFSTGVTIDFSAVLKGNLDNNYVQTVHASLTDVVLEEMPLGRLADLPADGKAECSKIATELINTGGYVCQGQKTLQATAEYKLGRDVQSKLESDGKPRPTSSSTS